ncbi:hypothetical protein AB4Z27_13405 [Cupriavidus sp. KB_39]|uniref:hypothetical protein n=1 Tax=Cupriavidus sp. KB_39 TaxID=3233036 RepID=UPI003F8E11CA
MGKLIRANAKVSADRLATILAELERWRDRELGRQLAWERIESFSGYSRQALSRHPDILRAFQAAKHALACPDRPSRSRGLDEELAFQDRTIVRLREELSRYERLEQQWYARWQRVALHCGRLGLSLEDLDRPLEQGLQNGPKRGA